MSDVVRKVLIQGVVQGVGYRAWVEHEAIARGLDGWVRNRRDGRVEALFAGAAETVAEMIARCARGPRMAQVDVVKDESVQSGDLELRYPAKRFSVLPTV